VPHFDDEQEALLMRLEDACQTGQPPDLKRFRPKGASPAFLKELCLTDQKHRWRRGLPCAVQDYVNVFAALVPDEASVLELILAEFAQRHKHGRVVSLAEYQKRFSRLVGRLAH
jgi:hypothetical protein